MYRCCPGNWPYKLFNCIKSFWPHISIVSYWYSFICPLLYIKLTLVSLKWPLTFVYSKVGEGECVELVCSYYLQFLNGGGEGGGERKAIWIPIVAWINNNWKCRASLAKWFYFWDRVNWPRFLSQIFKNKVWTCCRFDKHKVIHREVGVTVIGVE